MNTKFNCHQFLFGYDSGHRLLAGSRKLDRDEESLLLTYSDLIAHHVGSVESYMTGIRLPSTECYALMTTWMAPELRRPGCVWTHALIFTKKQMKDINLLEPPAHWFVRPELKGDYTCYKNEFEYNSEYGDVLDSDSLDLVTKMVRAIYEPNATRIFTRNRYTEKILFHIWMHQSERLKCRFNFRTAGANRSKSKYEKIFALRLVDEEVMESEPFKPVAWELLLATYVLGKEPAFASFIIAVGQHLKSDSNEMRFLAQLYLRIQELEINRFDWAIFISQFRQAIPSADGDKLISLFLDRDKMEKFSLSIPPVEQIVDMVVSEEDSGSDWCMNVNWENFKNDLNENQKEIFIEKILSGGDRLPSALVSFMLEHVGTGILRYNLDSISKNTQELIEKVVLRHNKFSEFTLSDKNTLRNLVHISSKNPELFREIVLYLIDHQHWDELGFLSKKYSKMLMVVIYDYIDCTDEHKLSNDKLVNALRVFPDHRIFLDLSSHVTTRHQLYIALKATEFNVAAGLTLLNEEWAGLVGHLDNGHFSEKKWVQVQAYLLAIALSRDELKGDLIFEICFRDVYTAWGNGQLNKISKKNLKNAIPGSHSPWTWDWCQELSQAVSSLYEKNGMNSKWVYDVVIASENEPTKK